jgi:hypothetical protein
LTERLKDGERGFIHRVHKRLDALWGQIRRFGALLIEYFDAVANLDKILSVGNLDGAISTTH